MSARTILLLRAWKTRSNMKRCESNYGIKQDLSTRAILSKTRVQHQTPQYVLFAKWDKLRWTARKLPQLSRYAKSIQAIAFVALIMIENERRIAIGVAEFQLSARYWSEPEEDCPLLIGAFKRVLMETTDGNTAMKCSFLLNRGRWQNLIILMFSFMS